MDEFLDILKEDSSIYSVTINDKKSSLFCEQRISKNGFPLVRISAKYDLPALTAWRANVSGENRPKYDANVDYISLIEQIGTNFIKAY